MTVQKFVKESKEEEKQSTRKQTSTLSIVPFMTKRKYDIYDKNVYLNKRESHIIAFGYLRNEQYILDIDLPCDLLEIMFEFYYNDKIKELLRSKPLPLIKSLTQAQEPQTKLFIQKLQLCETRLDFSIEHMENKYENAKDIKTNLLNEIIEFIAENTWLSNDCSINTLPQLIHMISKNLFRSLPRYISPYINSLSYINDDEKDMSDLPYNDPSWPHLQLIYDIFWRLINTPQFTPQMMETYLNKNFLKNLIQLFTSRQHTERQYLMMILHKIYGRSMKLRPIILDIIKHFLYLQSQSQSQSHYGISELLQIMSVILSGLKVPIKQMWHIFFKNVLVPLYKSYALKMFWEPLTHCCITYISKDINSVHVIFNILLKFWPQLSPQKEEIFINVIGQIIQTLVTNNNFLYDNHKNILIKIINKLSKCIASKRQTVSQATINLFQETFIKQLIDYDRDSLYSIIVTELIKNKNKNIKQLQQVEKIYKTLDKKYWKAMKKYLDRQDKKEKINVEKINELINKGQEPWLYTKKQIDTKYKNTGKPKRKLTNAEKMAKRKYYWKQIEKIAAINKSKFTSI